MNPRRATEKSALLFKKGARKDKTASPTRRDPQKGKAAPKKKKWGGPNWKKIAAIRKEKKESGMQTGKEHYARGQLHKSEAIMSTAEGGRRQPANNDIERSKAFLGGEPRAAR